MLAPTMSDEQTLQHAVAAAEAEVAALETERARLLAQRSSLTAEELARARARRDELLAASTTAHTEAAANEAERRRLLARARTPRVFGALVGGPTRWVGTTAAWVIALRGLVELHHWVALPGLTLAVLVALPIAFVGLVVAGSLYESAIDEHAVAASPAGTSGAGPAPGEGAARRAAGSGPDRAAGERAPGAGRAEDRDDDAGGAAGRSGPSP
jgi:hypothetical protein